MADACDDGVCYTDLAFNSIITTGYVYPGTYRNGLVSECNIIPQDAQCCQPDQNCDDGVEGCCPDTEPCCDMNVCQSDPARGDDMSFMFCIDGRCLETRVVVPYDYDGEQYIGIGNNTPDEYGSDSAIVASELKAMRDHNIYADDCCEQQADCGCNVVVPDEQIPVTLRMFYWVDPYADCPNDCQNKKKP